MTALSHPHRRAAILAGATALLAAVLLLALPAAAHAATEGGQGSIDGFLRNEDLADSRGNTILDYRLSLYDGGTTGLLTKFCYLLIWLLWGLFQVQVGFSIWLLDWIMSLGWVEFILTPLDILSSVIAAMVDRLNLTGLMLTILAVVVAYWLFRGRFGGAIGELFAGCIVAVLAVGALSDPMEVIAGDDGLITHAHEAGMDLATAITTDGANLAEPVTTPGGQTAVADGSAHGTDNGLTSGLVETFIGVPHQLLNYGVIMDGHPCESTYYATLGDEDARTEMGDCDEELQEFADNADPFRVISATSMGSSITGFALFSTAVVLAAFLAVLLAGGTAVKLIWDLVIGILPGGGRGALLRSAANLAFALTMVALSIAFTAAWMKIARAALTVTNDNPVPMVLRYHLFTILLIVGAIVLFVIRARLKTVFRTAAARLASIGPAKHQPAQRPHRVHSAAKGLSQAAHFAHNAAGFYSHARGRWGGRPTLSQQPVEAPPATTRVVNTPARTPGPAPQHLTDASRRPQLTAGPGATSAAGPSPTPTPGPSSRPQPEAAQADSGPRPSPGRRLRTRLAGAAVVAGVSLATSGTAGAAAKLAKTTTTAGKAARAAKTVHGAHRVATASKPPRTARNTQVRDRLSQVRHGTQRNGEVVDETTGTRYRPQTVRTGNGDARRVEILTPVSTTTPPPAAAPGSRLRDRLAHRKR